MIHSIGTPRKDRPFGLKIDKAARPWLLAALLFVPECEYPLPFQALLRRLRKANAANLGRPLIKSFIGVGGILAIDVCLSFAVAILLARSMGVAGVGIYSLALATGRILSPVLQLGLPSLIMREVNHGFARRDMSTIRGVVTFTFVLCVGLIAAYSASAYFLWPLIAVRLPEDYAQSILVGLFFAPAVAVTNICSGGLQGWHKVRTAAACTTVMTSGGMLSLVTLTHTLEPGWLTPARAVVLNVGAQIISLILAALLFITYTLPHVRGVAPSFTTMAWRRSMFRFAAVNGLIIGEQQMLTFTLGALASETQVGLFRIAQRAASLANLGLMAITRVVGPHIGQSYAQGEIVRLQSLLTRSAQAMGGSALIVFVVFALMGDELLELAVGAEFRPAYLPLAVLAFGIFIHASFGPLELLMNMTGQEGAIVRARLVAVAVAFAIAVVLMGENAAIGASVASSLGLLILTLMLWHDARRRLGCRTSALGL